MRVLVAVKRVPDPNQRIRVNADGSGLDLAGVRWVMNPYDEVALEQAVRWKESGAATEIVAASVGGSGCKDVLRSALALGADRAIHMTTSDDVPAPTVARALAEIVRAEGCDVAWMGAQSADDGSAETGPMLAALLHWPQATRAIAASRAGAGIEIERISDTGVEALTLAPPCVLTADIRLATPRFASLAGVMRAKKEPIDERKAARHESRPRVLSVAPVTRARSGERVHSAPDLVAALRRRGVL